MFRLPLACPGVHQCPCLNELILSLPCPFYFFSRLLLAPHHHHDFRPQLPYILMPIDPSRQPLLPPCGWDARVIQHCTAVPQDMLEPPTGGPVSFPCQTYFGVCQRVVNLLEKKALPDGRTLKGKEARKLVTKRPVAKPAVIKKKPHQRNSTPAASKMFSIRIPILRHVHLVTLLLRRIEFHPSIVRISNFI